MNFHLGLAKKSVGGGRVVEPFSEFLKTLRKPAAQDIREHLKRYTHLSVNSETKTLMIGSNLPSHG